VMGRERFEEDNEFLETDYQLPMNKMSQVLGRLQGDEWSLFVDGKKLHSMKGYKDVKFPAMQNASLWVGDRFYMPALANISWINYTILPDEDGGPPDTAFVPPPPPGNVPLFPGDNTTTVKYGYALPDQITTGRNFEVSIDIEPLGKSQEMTSILRLTKSDQDEGHYYDRMPAVFFYPESTLVHVTMGRTGDHMAHINPKEDLALNQKARVKVRLQGDILTLNINGKEEARLGGFEGYSYPPMDNVTVWVGDKFYQPANALLYSLNYTILSDESPAPTPAPLPKSTVMATKPTATSKGYRLPDRFNTSQNFELCFAMTPYGRKPVWRSIMRFTTTERDKGHYWDRMPALLFKPGGTEIRAYMGNQVDHDTYAESYSELQLEMTSRVCVRLEGDLFTLSVNGKLADYASGYCGAKYLPKTNVSVWVGDKFYDSADAELLTVNYTTLPDDIDYLDCLSLRNQSTVPMGPLIDNLKPGAPMLEDPRRIQFARLLADEHTTGRNFEVSFNITPYSKQDNLTSILRFTKSNNKEGSKFDNMPGFFFQPTSTSVLAVMGRSGKHHATLPSSQDLPLNCTSTVTARLQDDRFTLSINGSVAGVLAGFRGLAYPANSDVLVWSGDRFHPPADASISNLNYAVLPEEPESNAAEGNPDGSSESSSESPSNGNESSTTASAPDAGSEGDYWAGEPQGDSDTTEADESGDGDGSEAPAPIPETTAVEKTPAPVPTTTAATEAPVPAPGITTAKKAPAPAPKTTVIKKANPMVRGPEAPSPDEAPAPTQSPPGFSASLDLGNLFLAICCLILLFMLICHRR